MPAERRDQVGVQHGVDPVLRRVSCACTICARAERPDGAAAPSPRRACQTSGRKPAACSCARTAASILSVLTFASAMARTCSGLATTTRPTCGLSSRTIAVGIAGRLQHHFIVRPQRSGERHNRVVVQPIRPAGRDAPVLEDRHFGEGSMHVQPYDPHPASALLCVRFGEPAGNTTPTDPRSQRNRAGRRGGQILTRARSSCVERPAHLPCSRRPCPGIARIEPAFAHVSSRRWRRPAACPIRTRSRP